MGEDQPSSTLVWVKPVAILSLILYSGPIEGLIGTIVSMSRAFSKLEATGSADPQDLAADISIALLTTLYGLIFSLVGFTLILLTHFKLKFRAVWFYWATLTLSGILILFIPVGTI